MWKLFPNSWIEGAEVFRHRHAAAAEALERNWRTWLEEGLRRVSPRTLEAHGSDPVQALRALSGRALLRLDETLRAQAVRHSERVVPSSSTFLDKGEETSADAFLFVAACNPNGFAREQAIVRFAHYQAPLAFFVGLIRSIDWVTQVRAAAISLLKSNIAHLPPSDVARFLDIAVRLKNRVRVDQDLWQSIERRLQASDALEALRRAARDPNSSSLLRRSAFEYLMLGEPGNVPQILESALSDPDPRVGLWALAQSNGLHGVDIRVRLLKRGLIAKHAAVRRTALRQYVGANEDYCVQRLRTALFDRARGVRAFAAFELNRTHGQSALPIWRAAIDHRQHEISEVATVALCESGEKQDVERIASDGVARNALLRASILRGLWRVASPLLEPQLCSALKDSSTRVLRQVAEIYRRGTLTLPPATLEEALATVKDSLAPSLIALADVLGKWDSLELLLRIALGDHSQRAECAANYIDRWMLTANSRFTVPSHEQVQRLIRLSLNAQARHPGRNWKSIDFGLAAFAKS
jgi:hypothetical protein